MIADWELRPSPVRVETDLDDVHVDAVTEVLDRSEASRRSRRSSSRSWPTSMATGSRRSSSSPSRLADDLFAQPGDYSVVVLRKMIEGEWQTAILETSVAEPDSPYILSHSIAAIADLNGDGKMEIVGRCRLLRRGGNDRLRVHRRRPRARGSAGRRLRGLMLLAELVATSAEVGSTPGRARPRPPPSPDCCAISNRARSRLRSDFWRARSGRDGSGWDTRPHSGSRWSRRQQPGLTLSEVDEVLDEIPTITGAGSQERRARASRRSLRPGHGSRAGLPAPDPHRRGSPGRPGRH